MPLSIEVGFDPGQIALDGDPASPKRGTTPNFRSMLLWPNGWMDQDASWYEVGLDAGHIVLDGDPALPPRKGHRSRLLFSARIYCGQTVAHLSYC